MGGAIPFAPKKEMKEILKIIKSHVERIEKIELLLNEKKQYLNTLNQSILAKAFRGELVPQNPEDEPAAVLLERIRQEQKQNKPAKKRQRKKRNDTPTIPGLEA